MTTQRHRNPGRAPEHVLEGLAAAVDVALAAGATDAEIRAQVTLRVRAHRRRVETAQREEEQRAFLRAVAARWHLDVEPRTMTELVAALRNAGLTRREIAEQIGYSQSTVSLLITDAANAGLVLRVRAKDSRSRPRLSPAERRRRRDTILRMRAEGATNAAIARVFDVTPGAIGAEIRLMRGEGITVPARHTRNTRPISERERGRRRRAILHMGAQGASAYAIAKALGVPQNSVALEIDRMHREGIDVPRGEGTSS